MPDQFESAVLRVDVTLGGYGNIAEACSSGRQHDHRAGLHHQRC